MICVYENLVVPDAGKVNVCPKTSSLAATSGVKRQKTRAEVAKLPSSGDLTLSSSRRVSETVVFIQVSVSSRGLGSGQC